MRMRGTRTGRLIMVGSCPPPPPPLPRNQQCLTAEPGGGSCTHFPPRIRLRNQGLVLAHARGQPRTAEKKFSGALRQGMRALSFPTVNHIDK